MLITPLHTMFAKVYSQIFASSIAENYTTRHVFMDLLVLADSEGVVDMTASAISRTTNVPLDVVRKAIQELSEPDEASRSPEEEGRRIALIDSHRDWGWRIINYDHYRQLRDEEGRRAYHRDYMRKKRREAGVKPREGLLSSVKPRDAASTHAEGEGDAEGDNTPKPPKGGRRKSVEKVVVTDPLALRVAALFGRRESTPWLMDEWDKFKALSPSPEEVTDMEAHYASGGKFLRRDLKTLLNNWMGELDRFASNGKSAPYSPNL
jgi:hypothetical protein